MHDGRLCNPCLQTEEDRLLSNIGYRIITQGRDEDFDEDGILFPEDDSEIIEQQDYY